MRNSVRFSPGEKNSFQSMSQRYLDLLLSRHREEAMTMILEAVENKEVTVQDLYLRVFQPALYKIGTLWQQNKISVAHEHYCTAATQSIMCRLYPYILGSAKTGRTMVACSVGNELHEVGIRMVADFFEIAGWDTYYMGANTPLNAILDALKEHKSDILAISVTMMYNVHTAHNLVQKVRDFPECNGIKILVGGLPFRINRFLWQKIGADAMAQRADKAVEVAEELLQIAS